MGKRGPPKKPTALRVLHGTTRKGYKDEVAPPPSDLAAPAWLGKIGKELWNYLAPRIGKLKLLTELDRESLATMCNAYEVMRLANANIKTNGITQTTDKDRTLANPAVAIRASAAAEFDRWARQFGLTPAARQGMKSGDVSSDADELKFFGS